MELVGPTYAAATGLVIANRSTAATAGPMLGAEQIEQEWWFVREPSGWEWTACAVPIAKTSPMQTMPSA